MSEGWSLAKGGDPPPVTQFYALWDTGATESSVTRRVIDECGLTQEGSRPKVQHAFGEQLNVPTFLVNLYLTNQVIIEFLEVIEGSFGGADILIGMDIITRGDFAVTHPDGKTQFSFRIPSQAAIDFVKEAQPDRRPRSERRRSKRPQRR